MHAIVIDTFKEAGSVRVMPEPPLGRNAVLVRTTFAGVNPVDWKVRAGKGGQRHFPLVLGQDFAGVVERVGDAVTRVRPGDRVFGCARDFGSYAEMTVVPEGEQSSPFTKIPPAVSDDQAAALPTPGLTALASLEALGIDFGSELLLIGAAGAVGNATVQLARRQGAHVTAVVRPDQSDEVRSLGAEIVVEVEDDVVGPVRKAHPEPFAAVLDLVSSGNQLKANAPLYARGAKVVTTIHVADEAWFRDHGFEAINIVMSDTRASSPGNLDTLAALVGSGELRVRIAAERPFMEAAAVLDQLEAGKAHGKTLLRMEETG